MNKFIIFTSLILLSIFIQSCEEDPSDKTSTVKLCRNYSTQGTNLLDLSDEVSYGFIDLQELYVEVTQDSLFIEIGVKDLPNSLTFDHSNLSDSQLNYEWTINFDLDSNECSSEGDISIEISNYKFASEPESTGPILNNTQENIWVLDDALSATSIDQISNFVTINQNKFIIRIPKILNSQLSNITSNCKVYFSTYYDDGSTLERDFFPNI